MKIESTLQKYRLTQSYDGHAQDLDATADYCCKELGMLGRPEDISVNEFPSRLLHRLVTVLILIVPSRRIK